MENEKWVKVDKGNLHKFLGGVTGKGWGSFALSSETRAGLVEGGVKFVKGNTEMILTKQELIHEFKIGLEKGFFTKEDLLD